MIFHTHQVKTTFAFMWLTGSCSGCGWVGLAFVMKHPILSYLISKFQQIMLQFSLKRYSKLYKFRLKATLEN